MSLKVCKSVLKTFKFLTENPPPFLSEIEWSRGTGKDTNGDDFGHRSRDGFDEYDNHRRRWNVRPQEVVIRVVVDVP